MNIRLDKCSHRVEYDQIVEKGVGSNVELKNLKMKKQMSRKRGKELSRDD